MLMAFRLSAFQAGHIPSCCIACWRPGVLPTADACRWLLLLLLRLLSAAAQRMDVSVTARTVQGMARARHPGTDPQLNHLAAAGSRREELAAAGQVRARYHGSFAYITGVLRNGEQIPLFRLRYGGSAHSFGFAIYSAASNRYEDALLRTGLPAGTPQEALDTACTVHLADLEP